jgi:nucleotide-binding universal stress UspA family protein
MTDHISRNVLCPVDFSQHTDQTLAEAMAQTNYIQGHLVILHVLNEQLFENLSRLQGRMASLAYGGEGEEAIRALGDEREIKLRELIERSGALSLPHTSIITRGYPYEEILKLAEEKQVELIVMGAHGRTSLARQLRFGSQAEKVFRRAKCKVLFVR